MQCHVMWYTHVLGKSVRHALRTGSVHHGIGWADEGRVRAMDRRAGPTSLTVIARAVDGRCQLWDPGRLPQTGQCQGWALTGRLSRLGRTVRNATTKDGPSLCWGARSGELMSGAAQCHY